MKENSVIRSKILSVEKEKIKAEMGKKKIGRTTSGMQEENGERLKDKRQENTEGEKKRQGVL